MKIKWLNILMVILIIMGIYACVKIWPAIGDARDHIEAIRDHGDPTLGVIVISMILMTVIAIVHIICNKR